MAKATSLLKAYMNEEIPVGGGFIVSAFFLRGSAFGIYEITAYRNVKDIFKSEDGVTFRTDGNRAYLMVEPPTYSKKHIEPVNREDSQSIPYRFAEMDVFTARKSEKIFVGKEPISLYSSFTIVERDGDSFAFIFFPTQDVYVAIKKFIADSLYNDCNLGKQDAMQGAQMFLSTVKKFSIWNG